MAKPIYITDSDVESICSEIRSVLGTMKCYGNIDIKRSFKSDDRIAMLYFTPLAWIKMTALVSRFETEVQWHGMVNRISENEFEIYDIIVPPHEVSGTTVTSEYRPYIEWMDKLDDDTFNAVRFHGHSHVNMSVSPSSVDSKYRLDLVTQFPKPTDNEDTFYIFLIINKKHEWSAEIYDLTNNALYDTKDIYMGCLLEEGDVDSFVGAAKKVAVTRTYYHNPYSHNSNKGYSTLASQQGNSKPKSDGKKKGSGCYGGYDTLDEYLESVYGEGWYDESVVTTDSSEGTADDPNDPFYAKEY